MSHYSTSISPKIKICGLTITNQALACCELGADLLGFNCWRGSSRYVEPENIVEIVNSIPKSVTKVGVFVNESPELLETIMLKTGMDLAQLHGDETLEYVEKISVPWFKAFRFRPNFKTQQIKFFGQEIFLLDAYSKKHYGGTGKTIDWDKISNFSSLGKLILAGGLRPENICEAVLKVHPWAVDVCSGVEIEPGIKDLKKVSSFVNNIRKVK